MMFFDQVNNRTDHFRLHHFKNHRAGRKFRTVTCMFDRNALTTPVGIVMSLLTTPKRSSSFLLERASSAFTLRSYANSSLKATMRSSSLLCAWEAALSSDKSSNTRFIRFCLSSNSIHIKRYPSVKLFSCK